MTERKLPLTTRFTLEEYQLLEKARLRFRYRSLAELLHDAALHYIGHRRDVVRPTRARRYSQQKGVTAEPQPNHDSNGLNEGVEDQR